MKEISKEPRRKSTKVSKVSALTHSSKKKLNGSSSVKDQFYIVAIGDLPDHWRLLSSSFAIYLTSAELLLS